MNLSNHLPQIVPKPEFPIPETSKLANKMAVALLSSYRIKDGQNRTVRIYKADYYGGMLLYGNQKIALYLYNTTINPDGVRWVFLKEPEDNQISKLLLFDRFNAILKLAALSTLHEIVKNYWIFTDGVPWNGQRLFTYRDQSLAPWPEKKILTDRVFSQP